MSLVCAYSLNYGRGFCFLFFLRLQSFLVLLCLEFRYSIEKLNDYWEKLENSEEKKHTSLSGNNLKFSLMIFIFNSRNVTAHKSQAFFFCSFLAEFRLTLLLLTDFLGGSLVFCQYRLFNLIIIYLLVENTRESVSERVLKHTSTLVYRSPIIELRLPRHPLIIRICPLILILFVSYMHVASFSYVAYNHISLHASSAAHAHSSF